MRNHDEIWKLIGEEAEKATTLEDERFPGEKTFDELKELWKCGDHKARRILAYLIEEKKITVNLPAGLPTYPKKA